jgi:hypothetical protein
MTILVTWGIEPIAAAWDPLTGLTNPHPLCRVMSDLMPMDVKPAHAVKYTLRCSQFGRQRSRTPGSVR